MKQWDFLYLFLGGTGIFAVGSLDESDPIFYTQTQKRKGKCIMKRVISLIVILLLIAALVVAAYFSGGVLKG